MAFPVWHYDGKTASRQACSLVPVSGGFRLDGSSAPDAVFQWDALESVGNRQGSDVYALKGVDGWRIGFAGGVPAELKASFPAVRNYGGIIDRIGLWPAAGAMLAASLAAIWVVVSAPEYLAPLVPMSWEKKLGDAVVGDFGGRICNGPGARKVIDDLQARLDPKGPRLDVSVVNIDMVNAVALPGGRIMLFEGLLVEAEGPDEVAGVLGHEIGHVRNRHVTQALLRQFGLSLVLGGGNAGETLNWLIANGYSREAEAESDAHAITLLRKANVSPVPTAGFFARLAKMEKEAGQGASALGYLSSHPLSASREAEFRKSLIKGQNYRPILSDSEWKTLQSACSSDPDVKEDDGGGIF